MHHILLLHKNDKVAFQCVQPAILKLDGESYDCLPTTINWQPPPQVAIDQATGHTILHADKMKSIHSYWTLDNLNSPIPVEDLIVIPKEPKLSERINTYLQRTDPVRASLISGLTLSIIAVITLPCLVIYCCPQAFARCNPMTSLRQWRLDKKATRAKDETMSKNANKAIEYRDVPANIPDPSAPTLAAIHNKLNLMAAQIKTMESPVQSPVQ